MKRRYIIAILTFVICAAALRMAGWRDQEPQYKGKPLRYWLKGYHVANGYWNTATPAQADEAVVHLGTNALPTLLQMLRSRDYFASSPRVLLRTLHWSYTWRGWAQRQHFIKVATIPHLKSYEVLEAMQAFQKLGPDAKEAVPMLIKLYDEQARSNLPRGTIALIFSAIGPDARQATSSLMRTLANHDGSENLRGNTLYALSRIGAEPEVVVPAATKALRDPDPYVRRCAAQTLGAFGVNAKKAVPTLLEVLKNASEERQAIKTNQSRTLAAIQDLNNPISAAKQALKDIDPEAAAEAGIK